MLRSPARLGCLAIVTALLLPGPSHGDVVLYSATDPGAGPSDPRPNSNAMATTFDAAANALNPLLRINFEGLPLQQPLTNGTPFQISPEVSITTIGTDHSPAPGFSYGISNNPNDAITGYNTTTGGSQHFKFVPILGVGTAELRITLTIPIQAFGVYVTGLQTAAGTLHVLFNDGAPRDYVVPGATSGGVQFFGFTDEKALINSVVFQLQNVTGTSRDLFGLDDIRFAPTIPEPSSAVLLGLGLIALLATSHLLGCRPPSRSWYRHQAA
jgi:hypothetical protein